MLKTGIPYSTTMLAVNLTESIEFREFVENSLDRHKSQDWGDICEEDQEANRLSLEQGSRVVSKYTIPEEIRPELMYLNDTEIMIITEASRLTSTIMYPSEY